MNEQSWIAANQAYLAAEFKLIKDALAGNRAVDTASPIDKASILQEFPPAVERLAQMFGLTRFESQILLLCAGVEMDSELAALCANALRHGSRQCANFGLSFALFPDAHWSALTPSRPLRRLRLVELETSHALTSSPLHIDERILHYLAGVNGVDARLGPYVTACDLPTWLGGEQRATAEVAAEVIDGTQSVRVLHLCGDDANGQEDVAALAAHLSNRRLFSARSSELPAVGPELEQFIVLWQRESVLLHGALFVQCEPEGVSASTRHLAERLAGPLFLGTREPVNINRSFMRFDVNKPQPTEQKLLWQHALSPSAAAFESGLDDVSGQFRLSARTIMSTGSVLVARKDHPRPADLWDACRSLSRPKLEDLARRIVPQAGWEDLVLPESQKQVLKQLAAQMRHRMLVHETWGFSANGRRGLGISALFSGESGTGKTLAAEVLANELGLDLYCVDLSSVVSKYIGETEKNLKRVFDSAEEGGALLLFDEADALFGKRSEVRDSHDRYANIEVGYLLQRMESYEGLAILTTNVKSALDKAFQRRLRFTINFPFPDAGQRETMWRRAFPNNTPTVGLDSQKLAQLNVTGGNIRNIALNAAFLAAESTAAVEMGHVLHAARLEAQKIERPLADAETRGWL